LSLLFANLKLKYLDFLYVTFDMRMLHSCSLPQFCLTAAIICNVHQYLLLLTFIFLLLFFICGIICSSSSIEGTLPSDKSSIEGKSL
jgi:hypothetical protein